MKISKPCYRDDLSLDAYHGDCCDTPSLSHSGAHQLIEDCPALFFHGSPYNPTPTVREEKFEFDLGDAAHTLLLEPFAWEQRAVIIDAPDWRRKDAQEARADAYAAGKTPLLPKHRDQIIAMRDALLADKFVAQAFASGIAERSFFWRDRETGAWLKCRPDFLHDDLTTIHYKTLGDSVSPRNLRRRTWDHGWFSTVPWYEDGIKAVTGQRVPASWFIAQSVKPPYLVTIARIGPRAVEAGRIVNRKAIDIFAECVAAGAWPKYRDPKTPDRDTAFEIELPGYAEFEMEDRRVAGEFETRRKAKPSEHEKALAAKMFEPI